MNYYPRGPISDYLRGAVHDAPTSIVPLADAVAQALADPCQSAHQFIAMEITKVHEYYRSTHSTEREQYSPFKLALEDPNHALHRTIEAKIQKACLISARCVYDKVIKVTKSYRGELSTVKDELFIVKEENATNERMVASLQDQLNKLRRQVPDELPQTLENITSVIRPEIQETIEKADQVRVRKLVLLSNHADHERLEDLHDRSLNQDALLQKLAKTSTVVDGLQTKMEHHIERLESAMKGKIENIETAVAELINISGQFSALDDRTKALKDNDDRQNKHPEKLKSTFIDNTALTKRLEACESMVEHLERKVNGISDAVTGTSDKLEKLDELENNVEEDLKFVRQLNKAVKKESNALGEIFRRMANCEDDIDDLQAATGITRNDRSLDAGANNVDDAVTSTSDPSYKGLQASLSTSHPPYPDPTSSSSTTDALPAPSSTDIASPQEGVTTSRSPSRISTPPSGTTELVSRAPEVEAPSQDEAIDDWVPYGMTDIPESQEAVEDYMVIAGEEREDSDSDDDAETEDYVDAEGESDEET
ncbi:hypothetical protein BU25DRAFT_484438 [Macroventuria anomochaeta]|uniref:Uncharacterized protein n=1 Tax=Macroventuria anomochaeta TaxID=301207 RepID=A0ACB6S898_9PLEO|nr:uncharacterized protein BU25DRAFT_484438 [Macroventuria anomochaeta]KAF2630371.1 hypothetical protein BU25DRAFT_484438 [Macroventuria anomochaeta]